MHRCPQWANNWAMKILLIPGFMLDADLWADMRPGLLHFGPIIDADMTQDCSVEAIARRAIASTDGPMIVIGFSMGGYIAREIAYQVPQHVKGLALVATSSRGDAPGLASHAERRPTPLEHFCA